jgi:hypothetical protein
VRITRVKVGHRQTPTRKSPSFQAGAFLFAQAAAPPVQLDSRIRW